MTSRIAAILTAHRAGDPAAAGDLLAVCQARVEWLAGRLLPDYARVARHERPSDVAQEASVRLFQALQSTTPESEQHLLLLAAKKVREVLHDLARKHAGQRHGLGNLQSQGGVPNEQHPVTAAAAEEPGPATLDDWTRFHHAVESLPDGEREVMHLKWFLDLNEDEIAAVLGVSRSTVQRQWAAAKQKISAALGRERPR